MEYFEAGESVHGELVEGLVLVSCLSMRRDDFHPVLLQNKLFCIAPACHVPCRGRSAALPHGWWLIGFSQCAHMAHDQPERNGRTGGERKRSRDVGVVDERAGSPWKVLVQCPMHVNMQRGRRVRPPSHSDPITGPGMSQSRQQRGRTGRDELVPTPDATHEAVDAEVSSAGTSEGLRRSACDRSVTGAEPERSGTGAEWNRSGAEPMGNRRGRRRVEVHQDGCGVHGSVKQGVGSRWCLHRSNSGGARS